MYVYPFSKHELNELAKVNEDSQCPECKTGRIMLYIGHCEIGQSLYLCCQFGDKTCKFCKDITDYDNW